MAQIESMIHKLSERLETVEIKINELNGQNQKNYNNLLNISLSPKEKEIFLYLYALKGDLSDYKKIGRTLGFSQEYVMKYVTKLIQKGIPIMKKYFDNKVYLILDSDFRNLQAKENLLKL